MTSLKIAVIEWDFKRKRGAGRTQKSNEIKPEPTVHFMALLVRLAAHEEFPSPVFVPVWMDH